jgi:dTDP-4-dehydrorhamnose reductase
MKILISGADGQLGYELAHYTEPQPKHLIFALTHPDFDITNDAHMTRVLDELRPDIVINCAAYTAVDAAEEHAPLAFNVNTHGVMLLAKQCSRLDIPIIHFSTDYIFSGESDRPYTESDLPSPGGVYAQSKWEGEQQLRLYSKKHIILRLSWLNGFHGKNFMKTMLQLAMQRDQLKVVNDQIGCPTFAAEVAKQIYLLLPKLSQNHSWGTYHLCQAPVTSWFEFAKDILKTAQEFTEFELPDILPIRSEEYQSKVQRPKYSVLSTEKFEKTFASKIDPWQNSLRTALEEYFS